MVEEFGIERGGKCGEFAGVLRRGVWWDDERWRMVGDGGDVLWDYVDL